MKPILLALAAFFAIAAPAAAQSPFAGPGTPVVIGQGYDLPTKHYPEPRRINVQLPPGYDDPENKDRRYPVLYLLDGGAGWQDFAHIAGIVQQGGTWGINQPVILVGIESGDRRAEFTQASSDPGEQQDFPTHGKAETFRQFLVQDLKPAVDAAYRTDGTEGLIGESLAALFVVDVFLSHPGDFDRYIAISPSLWWDKQALAKSSAAKLGSQNQPPRTLWLSIADEGGAMQSGVDQVVAALKANPSPAVTWTYAPYPAEKHSTIYHPAATRAVREVFPAPKAPLVSAASHHLAYLLCATPRSGTTLLCDLLEATGQAGRPQSYYRRQDMEARASAWDLRSADFPDQAAFDRAYLSAVLRAGGAGTGIFGLRLMWGTVGELLERLAPLYPGTTEAARLTQAFGPLVYIHVSRRDKVTQAISLLKAEQSGLWHVGADGADRQRVAPSGPAVYDEDRIADLVDGLFGDEAGWNAFFAKHRIDPIRVVYEDLASNPRAEMRKLLAAMGRPPELADDLIVKTSRMADATSEDWGASFRQARGLKAF